MKTEQNDQIIEDCFNNYEQIQTQHLNAMRSKNVPDLEKMTKDRESIFEVLKVSLEKMMNNAGLNRGTDCLSELTKYENRLNSIMRLDDDIAIEIQKYRAELKTDISRIKKGKIAINGYRSVGANFSSPSVLSMTR